jgi:nitroreductase
VTPREVASLGEDVPLLEGIRSTRAIRRLRPDPVPRELIAKVCEAGTFAPSGGNRQPWIFIAVTEPERRAWVAERYRKGFHRYIAPALEAAKDPSYPEAGRRNMKAALHLADHRTGARTPVRGGWMRRGEARPSASPLRAKCTSRPRGGLAPADPLHPLFGEECDRWLGLPRSVPRPFCCRSAGRSGR